MMTMPIDVLVLVGIWVAVLVFGGPTLWHGLLTVRRIRRVEAESSRLRSAVAEELNRFIEGVKVARDRAGRLAGLAQAVPPQNGSPDQILVEEEA